VSSTREPSEGSHSYRTLREHILDPVASATAYVEQERSEIEAELAALESFETTVSDLSLRGGGFRPLGDETDDSSAAVRAAYRETVMAVDHYDREYGEPLLESIATEFSPEIAAFLSPNNQEAMTELHRSVIRNAIAESINTRNQFIERLGRELESLDEHRNDLAVLLNRFDGGYESNVGQAIEKLEDSSQKRQRLLHESISNPLSHEHEFREYLYDDEPWTYPVLTAIARLESAIEDEYTNAIS